MRTSKDEAVIARIGSRTYAVPRVCKVTIGSDSLGTTGQGSKRRPRWEGLDFHVSVEVSVDDDHRPVIRKTEVLAYRALQPRELAAIPWADVAEAALVANAAPDSECRRLVAEERRRALAAASSRKSYRKMYPVTQRVPVTPEVLRRVLDLRAEAEGLGVPYGGYVSEAMGPGYGVRHVRNLARRAARELAEGLL